MGTLLSSKKRKRGDGGWGFKNIIFNGVLYVALLDKASAQWGQGFEAVYQLHSFLERSDT